ncbi:MAG TPA: F0F1 ATP synthase subunit A [Phycisphaerales bacterium]|nr:F0F1 ATP synthase subunit A [Phycisphaerales bacterium]HMP37962.1 F0F1 ATP synthase subunit A [Phycisphaerales bacterium]
MLPTPASLLLLAADAAGGAHKHVEPGPLDHSVDIILWKTVGGATLVSTQLLTLFIAAIATVFVMLRVSRAMETGPESDGHRRYLTRGRFGQFFEAIIVYLRDQMIRPMLGDANTARYTPFLLTLFFFIWICNVIGLVPLLSFQHLAGGVAIGDYHWAMLGGTATANISVTAGLAVIAFVAIQAHGFRELGVKGWAHHLLGGGPWWLAPLMVPVELIGMIIKPAALAIRLFANMLAGHTLMATVLLFGYMALSAGLGWLVGGSITVVSGVVAVALMLLELFVATLQAFVFMFLTTVFISLMSSHDHDHEQGHEHAHGGGHGEAANAGAEAMAH